MSVHPDSRPCPSCGRCPACGRGGSWVTPFPYSPFPYWSVIPPSYPYGQWTSINTSAADTLLLNSSESVL